MAARNDQDASYQDLLHTIISGLSDGILVVDTGGRVLFLNEAAAGLLGRSREQLLGREFGYPLVGKEPSQISIVQPDGIERVVEMRASAPTHWQDADAFLVTLCDVTRQLQISERLRRIEKMFDHTAEGIIVTDEEHRILEVNEAFTIITGYVPEEVIGKTPSFLKSGQHSPVFFRAVFNELEKTGSWTGEIMNRRRNGEVYPQWSTISVVRDEDGYITNYVMNLSDMTVLKHAEDELWHLAHSDHLTGLPNRNLFYDRLGQMLLNARRNRNKTAVLYIDLNEFKDISEGLSYDIGDHVLKEVAGRINGCLRSNDTLARVGGDEFAVAAGGERTGLDATALAVRIMEAIEQPVRYNGIEAFLKASIGISLYPDDADEPRTLIRNAHLAVYEAKKREGGSYHFYNQIMHVETEEKFLLNSMMHKAVMNEEFEFHLQPIMELAGEGLKLAGGEALIRWHHAERGYISPERFIPVAESTGIIKRITAWMLEQACSMLQDFRDGGRDGLYISVNVSAQDILQGDFVAGVAARLQRYSILPGRLQLEITERVIMEDSQTIRRRLEDLRALGVKLAIDDFGTGYSSLSYLKTLAVDKLKIDHSFVRDLPQDRSDLAVCRAIASLAHSLDLTVVAEGVESRAIEEMLASLACEEVQGFLYGKPLPAAEF